MGRVLQVWAPLLVAAGVLSACGDTTVPARELGARRFRDPGLSTSPLNTFSCASCHGISPPGGPPPVGADGRHLGPLDPGYNLANTVNRPSWWGGQQLRLLDAVNFCLRSFMGGRELAPDEEAARQLYELLVDASPETDPPPLPLTYPATISDLAVIPGDAKLGEDVYNRACRRCHPTLPAVPFPEQARRALVEKVRRGKFFAIGGVMPPFSFEVLSDEELADILRYFRL